MKVIAINGSPRKNGNTQIALEHVGVSLQEENIQFEIVQIGDKIIRGCMACNKCFENKDERCIMSDVINPVIQQMKEADGIILASPVFYSGIAGTMKCFLDRVFYVANANGGLFRHKVGAAIAVARRSGGTMTFNSLNHYLTIAELLIPGSNYWNVVHGHLPGEAIEDKEGMSIMNVLGKNMAWLLKMKEETKDSLPEPEKQPKIATNFIR